MKQLKCLYLQSNCLTSLKGVELLKQLVILDVSYNKIEDTTCLEQLPHLSSLYINNNCLSAVEKMKSLSGCSSLSTLDLSKNKLEDAEELLTVLERLTSLRALYLHGNAVVRNIDPYRIHITIRCANLTYLDDRPIREQDRASALAWIKDGNESLEKERKRWNDKELAETLADVDGLFQKLGNNTINSESNGGGVEADLQVETFQ